MIIHEHEQGSPEWLQSRIGVATASRFADIMTLKQKKAAKNAYIYELTAEILTGQMAEFFTTDAMQRGTDMEPEARMFYEFKTGKDVREVGLITDDDASFGCSPDGLIEADNGGLEIKCPGLKKHLEYLDKNCLPSEYTAQVYGCLYITGRDYWDFISYHPDARELHITVKNDDEEYLAWKEAFKPVLDDFLGRVKRLSANVADKEFLAEIA